MTFRLTVDRRYVTYTGYTMRYLAVGKFLVIWTIDLSQRYIQK